MNALDTIVQVVVRESPDFVAERLLIDDAIARVLVEIPEGGMLDSHLLAKEMVRRRTWGGRNADPTQTKDYVQHCLRETRYVCRHAVDEHFYRVHAEAICSPKCVEKYAHALRKTPREHCLRCFLEVTTTGLCPMGCDE